VHMTG